MYDNTVPLTRRASRSDGHDVIRAHTMQAMALEINDSYIALFHLMSTFDDQTIQLLGINFGHTDMA